jgi:hypothetical protein
MCSWCIRNLVTAAYGQAQGFYVVGMDLLDREDRQILGGPVNLSRLDDHLDAIRKVWDEHPRGQVDISVAGERFLPPITTWQGDPICPPHLDQAHRASVEPTTVRMAQWAPRRAA